MFTYDTIPMLFVAVSLLNDPSKYNQKKESNGVLNETFHYPYFGEKESSFIHAA